MGGFDEFWKAYPRRVAKGAALKAWAAAEKREADLLDKCLRALAWQIPTNGWDGGHYTPHPSTYLNQERWTDENPVVAKAAKAATDDAAYRAMRERVIAEQDARARAMEGR